MMGRSIQVLPLLMAFLAGCVGDAHISVYVHNRTDAPTSVHAKIVRIGDSSAFLDETYDVAANVSFYDPSEYRIAQGRFYLNVTAANLKESIDRELSDSNGGWRIVVYWDRIESSVSTT